MLLPADAEDTFLLEFLHPQQHLGHDSGKTLMLGVESNKIGWQHSGLTMRRSQSRGSFATDDPSVPAPPDRPMKTAILSLHPCRASTTPGATTHRPNHQTAKSATGFSKAC
jgi:hypothetical protein